MSAITLSPHTIDEIVRALSMDPTTTAQAYSDLSEKQQRDFKVGAGALFNQLLKHYRREYEYLPAIGPIHSHMVSEWGIDYRLASGEWVRDTNIAAYRGGYEAVLRYWAGIGLVEKPSMSAESARRLRSRAPQYRGRHGKWLKRFDSPLSMRGTRGRAN